MHGNFNDGDPLNPGGNGATVSGWVAWDKHDTGPASCSVTVEVKQSSGPGSAKAKGTSPSYNEQRADQHVPWSANCALENGSGPLQAGSAEATGWIKDPNGQTVFQWKKTVNLTG
jgi:hypothetical protein